MRLTYEHLFCKYFVRRSVRQATKGRNVERRFSLLLIKIDD